MWCILISETISLPLYIPFHPQSQTLPRIYTIQHCINFLFLPTAANTPPSFVSITELHGDQSQPALRANTTLLVQLGNSYTYRVLFTDPDEGDNITLSLREDVPGAMIEDGKSSFKLIDNHLHDNSMLNE